MSVFKKSLWFLLAGPLWLLFMIANHGSPNSSETVLVAIVVFGISMAAYFSVVISVLFFKKIKLGLSKSDGIARVAIISLLTGPTTLVLTILLCWRFPEDEHEWLAALSSAVVFSLISFFIVHSAAWVLAGFVKKA